MWEDICDFEFCFSDFDFVSGLCLGLVGRRGLQEGWRFLMFMEFDLINIFLLVLMYIFFVKVEFVF